MRYPGYREALRWIAENDDTDFLNDEVQPGEDPIASVTLCMVADLFDVQLEKAIVDLRKMIEKLKP